MDPVNRHTKAHHITTATIIITTNAGFYGYKPIERFDPYLSLHFGEG